MLHCAYCCHLTGYIADCAHFIVGVVCVREYRVAACEIFICHRIEIGILLLLQTYDYRLIVTSMTLVKTDGDRHNNIKTVEYKLLLKN